MFEKLKRIIVGVYGPENLVAKCEDFMLQIVEDEDLKAQYRSLRVLAKNRDWLRGCKEELCLELRKAGNVSTRSRQWTQLRMILLDKTENLIDYQLYCSEKYSDDDRKILYRLFVSKDLSYEQAQTQIFQGYMISEASVICLRLLLVDLYDDAEKHDYFELYSYSYRKHRELFHRCWLLKERNENYSVDYAIFEGWKRVIRELRTTIDLGKNLQFSEELLEQMRQEKEEESKRTASSK